MWREGTLGLCVAVWTEQEQKRRIKKELDRKLKKVEQHKHAEEEERIIVQEMLKDFNKCFNNNDDYHINQ